MPNRLIKESLLTSETVANLTSQGERHMVRLLLLVDDYGCLEVTPRVLRGRAYPLIVDEVTIEDVDRWTRELERVGIIQKWSDGGRVYALFNRFDSHSGKSFTDGGKRTRNRRKTPAPPVEVASIIVRMTQPSEPDGAKGSQGEPDGAKGSPVPVPVPVPVPSSQVATSSSDPGRCISTQEVLSNSAVLPEISESQRTGPRRYRASRDDEERILSHQIESLNKCEGAIGSYVHRSGASLRLIARHVPEGIVILALGRMQDARLNALNPDAPEQPRDLTRFYIGVVKSMCAEESIRSPFDYGASSTPQKHEGVGVASP